MRLSARSNRVFSLLTLVFSTTVSLGLPTPALAGECASPGRDGSGPLSGLVNTFWAGQLNPSAGATSFSVGPSTGASTPIATGDLLLLFQTQDGSINSTNTNSYGDGVAGTPANGVSNIRQSGRFEFARAASNTPLSGGTLTISSPAVNDYTSSAATATSGQRSYQIIRVPQYLDASLSSSVTASPWNGKQGGVVVIDVANTLTFAGGTIDVSQLGFRGGGARSSTTGSGASTDYRTPFSNGANGAKGEGIAGTPRLIWNGVSVTNLGTNGYPNGDFARGAPGNAGGGGTDGRPADNSENTGGGGGAGYGAGGKGGHAWCAGGPAVCAQTGGFGGKGINVQGVDRITLGGGGGAGSTNNATGTPGSGQASSGATGGGIVILRAGSLTGSGTILADGENGNSTVDNDGSGGGGGGGAILLTAQDSTGLSLSVSATGGDGGTNGNSTPHGPGGGGGGGYIGRHSAVSGVSGNIAPGQPGLTDGNTTPFSQNYGAEAGTVGSSGSINATNIPGFSSGEECRVDISKIFDPNITVPNAPVRLTVTLTNPNPSLPMNSLTLTDTFPTNVMIAPTPNSSSGCGGTVTATPGDGFVTLSGASLAALSSCDIEVDVIASGPGNYQNTIPAGNASASISGKTISNTLLAQDDLQISSPLNGSKAIQIIPTTQNPDGYALPGATVEYAISFENPSSSVGAVENIIIKDAIPSEVIFNASDIAGVGSGPAVFDDGSPTTGLSPVFEYSNDGGSTYAYTPVGVQDTNVTHIRFSPTGAMSVGTTGTIRFRVFIR